MLRVWVGVLGFGGLGFGGICTLVEGLSSGSLSGGLRLGVWVLGASAVLFRVWALELTVHGMAVRCNRML